MNPNPNPPTTDDPTKPAEVHIVTRQMFPRVVGMEQQGQDTMNGRAGGDEVEEVEEREEREEREEGTKGGEGEEEGKTGGKIGGRRRRRRLLLGRHQRRQLLFGSIMKGGPLQILPHDVDTTKCWNDA